MKTPNAFKVGETAEKWTIHLINPLQNTFSNEHDLNKTPLKNL